MDDSSYGHAVQERSTAARLLWNGYLSRRGRAETRPELLA
jgi:hypothetical protein